LVGTSLAAAWTRRRCPAQRAAGSRLLVEYLGARGEPAAGWPDLAAAAVRHAQGWWRHYHRLV